MSGPPRSVLATACFAEGLPTYGSKAELTTRLGKHLVEQKLGVAVGKKRANSSDVPALQMKRVKRPLTKWQAFMKSEMPNIKASGYTGLTDCIKELARRWALVKKVGTSKEPLFFSDTGHEGNDEVDALANEIKELPHAEVKDALVAHGLPISDSADANAKRLALVVYI